MRLRIKDIASRAHVSVGTVDRVLHNRGEVSQSTRKKILAIVEEFKYQPDILASALASKKGYRIAVLIPKGSEDSEFWEGPLSGINKALNEMNHFGIHAEEFLYEQKEKESFLTQAGLMLASSPDAVIVAPFFYVEAEKVCKQLHENNIPFVLVNSNTNNVKSQISFIGQNSWESGKLAGKLLHYGVMGKPSFLVVNILKDRGNYYHIFERQGGFIDYFKRLGIEHIDEVIINGTSQKAVDKVMKDFFSAHSGNVNGIFVTNSKVYRIAEYLKKNDLDNIHLLGYDLIDASIPYLQDGTIDFLIGQRPEEQGYRSVMALFNHLVLKKNVEHVQYMPLDIITKENLMYYRA